MVEEVVGHRRLRGYLFLRRKRRYGLWEWSRSDTKMFVIPGVLLILYYWGSLGVAFESCNVSLFLPPDEKPGDSQHCIIYIYRLRNTNSNSNLIIIYIKLCLYSSIAIIEQLLLVSY